MKKEKVLIACSGGPDSMALLDMYKNKKKVFVCHINYHQRKTAKRDENIVRKYCKKWNIPFYKFDYKKASKGNFQKLARDFRYKCFREVCGLNNIKVVYVAHQMEDNIETYLMQLKRKTSVNHYGISKRIKLNGLNVYRPLINKTKQQLLKYLEKNNIEYGIDESNYSNKYERNKIRHGIVDKMTYDQKLLLIKEINKKNDKLDKEINDTVKFINSYSKYPYNKFINYKNVDRLLRILLYSDLSSKYIEEIKKALSNKNNIELLIKNKYICKEYGYIYVYEKQNNYKYTLYDNKTVNYKYFKVSKKGTTKEAVYVNDLDFPITIRNYKEGDIIKMLYGSKKVNRFFIDNKISSFDRKIWPIVLNKKGDIILVPGIGCSVDHYAKKPNLYVLKLTCTEF